VVLKYQSPLITASHDLKRLLSNFDIELLVPESQMAVLGKGAISGADIMKLGKPADRPLGSKNRP
jgi:hypothetical protein